MLEVRNVYLGFAAVFHTCVLQEARSKTAPHNLCSLLYILSFSPKNSAPLLTLLGEYSASILLWGGKWEGVFYRYMIVRIYKCKR